jgi:hypothetical protein
MFDSFLCISLDCVCLSYVIAECQTVDLIVVLGLGLV